MVQQFACRLIPGDLLSGGNNLTNLSHQAKSNTWQQTISIHTSNNHGTENNKQNNFDANGNLLHLDITIWYSSLLVVLFQATYYQVQNIHAYLHEVVEVRQQILKAFLIFQYLGMTKIAGALNMLPKTMLRHNITNPSTNETIKIYKADRDYPRFYILTIFSSLSYASGK
jgi:hypothetical protein